MKHLRAGRRTSHCLGELTRDSSARARPLAHSARHAHLVDEVHEEGVGLHLVFQLVKDDQGRVAKPRCFCRNTITKQKLRKIYRK